MAFISQQKKSFINRLFIPVGVNPDSTGRWNAACNAISLLQGSCLDISELVLCIQIKVLSLIPWLKAFPNISTSIWNICNGLAGNSLFAFANLRCNKQMLLTFVSWEYMLQKCSLGSNKHRLHRLENLLKVQVDPIFFLSVIL